MSRQDLTHLKPGDKIAVQNKISGWQVGPVISQRVYRVTSTTETQAKASNINTGDTSMGSLRFRLSDGKVIGRDYTYAIEATPAMLKEHAAQVAERKRWNAARKATDDLIGKELHQLNLTTAQLERLAAAWAEVKAMGSKT